MYGDNKIKLEGLDIDARKVAGPEPIDLPKRTMSLESYFILFLTKSNTI